MPEHTSAGWMLLAALLASVAGMGWLALSMPVHAAQVWGAPLANGALRLLRWFGIAGVLVSLRLCLHANHASMAVLVWVMALSGAALLVAFLLAARPRWLRLLAPWAREQARNA
ncbi:MAG: DUF3325 domain-containing protein [Thermomonas sp.]|uniref:DUF3325 domain-containing protein n=1 Tax=Thermomonas sp. TaxID=1971895 RepID=UPI0039E3AB5E